MKPLQIGDMFCGAGGSTTGIKLALESLGLRSRIWAINHWNVAIETHSSNNADVEHICTAVEQIDPTRLIPGRELDPFITRFHGGPGSEKRNHSIDDPLPVIDTSNRYAVVEPFITAIGHSSIRDRSRSIDEPLSTCSSPMRKPQP